jgi:hypothetical protein
MMNTIKFSHTYPKLWNQETARLLKVERIIVPDDFSESFREYDTQYIGDPHYSTGKYYEYYPIKNGKYLLLVFLGNHKIPFTTLRKDTADKADFYLSKIGYTFKIEIEEQEGE